MRVEPIDAPRILQILALHHIILLHHHKMTQDRRLFFDPKKPRFTELISMASIDLETFIDDSIRISKVHGYVPTAFIGMRSRHGTIDAISRLVISGDIQSGFRRMITLGLIDYTLEAAVEKFPSEFTKNERECAAFRLKIGRGGGQKRDNN